MNDAILVSYREEDLSESVRQVIHEAGYALHWTDDPTAGHVALRGPESLVIIEAGLQRDHFGPCDHLIESSRSHHVPCLVFSAGGAGPESGPGSGEISHGFIHTAGNLEEWREKLSLYRQISYQAQELKSMQQRLLARSEAEEEDLRSAALIQQSLLPKKIPDVGGFHFAWQFAPFEKVGGDLFNVLQVDEETVMAFLLDVSGHGISSAMVTVSVNQSLSLHTGQLVKSIISEPPYYRLLSPAEVMLELTNEYPFDRFDKFFTIVYLLINIRTGEVRYSCAGHPPPLLQRRDGQVEWLATGGGLIGLDGTGPYEEGRITLQVGDRLFLYSDGLPDYCDFNSNHFGTERLMEALTRDGKSLQQSCGSVLDELRTFGDNRSLQDDVSLLGMEFVGQ